MRKKKTKVDIEKLLKQYEKQKERTKRYLQSVEKKTLIICKKEKFKEIVNFICNELNLTEQYNKDEAVKKEVDEITKLLLTIAVAEKKLENYSSLETIRSLTSKIKSKI